MKVAICLSGLLREFELSWNESLVHIKNKYNADVFVSVWDNIGYWSPGDEVKKRGFVDSGTVNINRLKDFYSTDNVIVENFESVSEQLDDYTKNLPEFFLESIGHSNFLARRINTTSMYYKINSVVNLANSVGKYDYIIRTRPDIILDSVPDLNMDQFYLIGNYIHQQHNGKIKPGHDDNFQAGPSKHIKTYSEIYTNLHELFEYNNKVFCPHVFCLSVLEKNNIEFKTINIPYKIMHTPGGAYNTIDSNTGQWKHISEANYQKTNERFKG